MRTEFGARSGNSRVNGIAPSPKKRNQKKIGCSSHNIELFNKNACFLNLVFEGDATVVCSLRHDFPEDRSRNAVQDLEKK